jgi:hypothetical protein
MRRALLILLAFFTLGSARAEQKGTGLDISVAGDIVDQFGPEGTKRIDVREAEFLFYAPVDHLFDGQVSFAAHTEATGLFAEVHEAFIGSSRLIPRSRFRVGQFFLGFGRLNQFHRHDWPFTTAPKVHSQFFAAEAAKDTGFEYSYLTPLPFYLDLTAGLTSGWVFGHAHTLGTRPLTPTHYLRALTYFDLPWKGGLQTGLNYVGRRNDQGTSVTFLGVDTTAKWREGPVVRFLLQGEFWARLERPRSGAATDTIGFYVHPEYALGGAFSAALRFDYLTVTSLKFASGGGVPNYEAALMPQISWKPSEFTTVRLSYTYRGIYKVDRFVGYERFAELQTVFLLGAHPAHDF